ncbi:hypothetical protein G4O51_04420 [Candidatus Bathyarchaeota archaeon A05DMB-2]|jgi:hypothetical protein|nr:hypothetical protein [Candidatus Bathyarchaeota archaeon A05DMB-2]
MVEKLTLKKLSVVTKKIINALPEHLPTRRVLSQKQTRVFISIVTLTLLSGFLFVEVMSAVQTSLTISNTGAISISTVGVSVYWDSAYSNKTSSINWGTLDPGAQKSVTVYIRNEGSLAVTLTLSTSNWSPSTASNYLTLTWNYNGQTINPGASVQVRLTLTTSASVTGVTAFSFNIVITGSG